jgi:hypothetical protein
MKVVDIWPIAPVSQSLSASFFCGQHPSFQVLFSSSNELHFGLRVRAMVRISFDTTKTLLSNHIPVTMLSPTSGFLTSPGYDGLHYRPSFIDITHTLTLPAGYVAVMISFENLHVSEWDCRQGFSLNISLEAGTDKHEMPLCTQRSALVFRAREMKLRQKCESIRKIVDLGFKMYFSFHEDGAVPEQEQDGRFNCSVSYYSSFKLHLDCNMYDECADGQDEGGHCWFSSPACQGKLASGSKCFFTVHLVNNNNNNNNNNNDDDDDDDVDAMNDFDHQGGDFVAGNQGSRLSQLAAQCEEKGGELAVIQTRKELDDVTRLISFGKINAACGRFFTGTAMGDDKAENMYSQMWLRRNNWVLYTLFSAGRFQSDHGGYGMKKCEVVLPHQTKEAMFMYPCTLYKDGTSGAVCESRIPGTRREVVWRANTTRGVAKSGVIVHVAGRTTNQTIPLAVCPRGHLTHAFLQCDVSAECGAQDIVQQCTVHHDASSSSAFTFRANTSIPTDLTYNAGQPYNIQTPPKHDTERENKQNETVVQMFVCVHELETVHYSQVCDFHADCTDVSDESFCQYSVCQQFTCDNGQCVASSRVCDMLMDCLDNSDEASCEKEQSRFSLNTVK